MLKKRPFPLAASTAVASLALLLAACDRPGENTTAGEKLDAAIATTENKVDAAVATTEKTLDAAVAKTEQKMDEVAADAKSVGQDIKQAASNAADAVADTARDATITAEVKGELAKDKDLSALAIDVDTSNGRVSLSGSAPSDSAREKATTLAANVKGVSSVDNRLVVQPNS